jgi:hypothetical protein
MQDCGSYFVVGLQFLHCETTRLDLLFYIFFILLTHHIKNLMQICICHIRKSLALTILILKFCQPVVNLIQVQDLIFLCTEVKKFFLIEATNGIIGL